MHSRAVELIRSLMLEPHPEGGYFAQAFRSEALVAPSGWWQAALRTEFL